MSRRDDGSYWEKRRLDLLGQLEKDEERLYKRLEKVYASEIAKLERDIAAYYRQYGESGVVAYRKMLAAMTERDRRLLLEQMDEFAKRYPQYAHLMPVRESIYKLNEMEGIQLSMRIQQLRIGAIEEEEVTAHLEKLAQRSANLAAEQMGFGTAFYAVDASVVKAVVDVAWAQGESFSERIWGNRQKLAAYLADDFAKAIARGASYERITREISDRFDGVSKRNIRRLVYTEGTYVFNESHARVHAQWYSHYSLSTVTDGRACDQCRDVERATVAEPALFEERMPGANFPPLHPGCRCSYVTLVERDGEKPDLSPITDYGETSVAESNGADSLAKHTVDGKLSDEREELHRSILDSLFKGKRPVDNPVFTVMGGGSASGKSTMIDSGAVSLVEGTTIIDSDAIKAMLPEYREMLAKGDPAAARYVHEESSALAKRALYVANAHRFNVTLDGTGDGSVKSMMAKISNAKNAGMRIEGVYATVPTDVAVARSMARAAATGRFVPEEDIRTIHRKVSQILPEIAGEFDEVSLYYTGQEVLKIASGGNGSGLVAVEGREDLLEDFLAKADE